jgi:autotransporter-associated beta strand protein
LIGNLNVAPTQTVALGTADGYKITLGGTAAGNGTVVIKSGEVETTTSTALQNLNLVVGQTAATTLRLTAPAPNLLSLGGSSAGTLIVGPGTAPVTLTLGGGANARFNGAITQNNNQVVSLVKNGANTQTLAGLNTFTGGVTVNAGTLELRAGSIGTNAITLSGGTLQFIGTGLLGQFYSGDDGGANANFNAFANYSSYFAGRTPNAVSSTDIPNFPTLSFASGGGDTQMYLDFGFQIIITSYHACRDELTFRRTETIHFSREAMTAACFTSTGRRWWRIISIKG